TCLRWAAFCAVLWATSCATTLAAAPAQVPTPLFADDTPLEVSIAVDFRSLCRPRETEDCEFTPSTLGYRDAAGRKQSLPVEIKIRGGWRSLTQNCSVPLLWLRFEASITSGTPFEGQTLLPLTTHCGKGLSLDPAQSGIRRSEYEQYLLREFLVHRLYNTVTDYSLRVRLLRVSYPSPGGGGSRARHWAFLSEHFDDAATRLGAERLPRSSFDATQLAPQPAATLALFQYMIGNTDWSIARERNTVLLSLDERQIPIPYDFDMSGLVNAGYAGPAPGLPIDEVRERYFLGYCQPGTDWERLFAEFTTNREALLALGETIPGLGRNGRKSTEYFLNGFFRIIGSAEERMEKVIGVCQPWPPAAIDHMTPINVRGG
ncbi:MAG: hypothetical protein ACSLE2_03430, partial [Lysobacterales bacterium]